MSDNLTPSSPNQEINWSEIHQRLEINRQALEEGRSSSPEAVRLILRKRARQLAKEPQAIANQEFIDVVEFLLGAETYGIESAFVREVFPLKDFTPLPGTPSYVLGIVNVRGQILSILDLKKFFNVSGKGLGQMNKLIILYNENMEFGILADEILGTHSIALDQIQDTPPTVIGIGADYLLGVTRGHIILLDAGKILADEKIIVDQQATY